jgi:hypothetical protein
MASFDVFVLGFVFWTDDLRCAAVRCCVALLRNLGLLMWDAGYGSKPQIQVKEDEVFRNLVI